MARVQTLKPGIPLLDAFLRPVESASERRVRGRRLQEARRRLFQSSPLCVKCEELGVVREAVERDHIIPLHKGGQDVPENTQGLCADCHAAKTHEDMGQGGR